MSKQLIEKIREHIVDYELKVLDAIEVFKYQKDRYDINYTIAIGASDADIDMSAFKGLIRKTDGFSYLEDNICVMIFAFNDANQGIKAASNMLSKFEMQYFGKKIYLGMINSQEEEKADKQIKKLFETLCYGIENGMSNIPLDYDEISSMKARG